MPRASKSEQKRYQKLAKRHEPPRPLAKNVFWAFVVGGAISVVGQAVLTFFQGLGALPKDALSQMAAVMVVLGALLTGLGIYDDIGKVGGMGAALPITGFANSITAPALEYKREGYVMGVTAKLFTVAGPVIVFGLSTAILVTLIRYFLT